MIAWFLVLVFCWLIALLRASPQWWRWLNEGGAQLGRGIAWFCSGGPGLAIGRWQIEAERRADAMARLMLEAQSWRWRARYPNRPTGVSMHYHGTPPISRPASVLTSAAICVCGCPVIQHAADHPRRCFRCECPFLQAVSPDRAHLYEHPLRLCPVCFHGNHACTPGRCRCPGQGRW